MLTYSELFIYSFFQILSLLCFRLYLHNVATSQDIFRSHSSVPKTTTCWLHSSLKGRDLVALYLPNASAGPNSRDEYDGKHSSQFRHARLVVYDHNEQLARDDDSRFRNEKLDKIYIDDITEFRSKDSPSSRLFLYVENYVMLDV